MRVLRNIFFILGILFWGISVQAGFLSEKGASAWHELPFADIRLLSCSTGRLERTYLAGGLQIKIHPDWVLKKPDLKPLSRHGAVEYPIRPHPVNFDSYTGTILIPLIYNVSTDKDTTFGVHGDLTACRSENCLTIPIQITLPLDDTESDYSSFCAYIMDEMHQIPQPMQIGWGRYMDDHTALLRFYVPRLNQAFLQNQNGLNFQINSTYYNKDFVQFEVSYPETWPQNKMRDWILITDQGIFRVPIVLTNQTLPPPKKEQSRGLFIWAGLILFICSPFFILWGTAFPKTNAKLRKQCLRTMIYAGVLTVLATLIEKYIPGTLHWMTNKQSYILWLMGLTLMFPPRFTFWAALLYLVWPKPYLRDLVQNFPIYYLIPWLLLWQMLPFAVLYRYADFWAPKARRSLKKDFFCHNLFFLMPTIILLLYGIHQARLNIPYANDWETDPEKINVVCEKTDCETWMESKLDVRLTDAESALGKTLLDLYQAQENLVFLNDQGIQTILTDVNPKKVRAYLTGLQNYRAGYRPTDPPVHSGDAPHAPSPNAM